MIYKFKEDQKKIGLNSEIVSDSLILLSNECHSERPKLRKNMIESLFEYETTAVYPHYHNLQFFTTNFPWSLPKHSDPERQNN